MLSQPGYVLQHDWIKKFTSSRSHSYRNSYNITMLIVGRSNVFRNTAAIQHKGDFISENEWYDNPKVVSELISDFEKAGLPLEYKAKKIFEKYGFEADEAFYRHPLDTHSNSLYESSNSQWRQIDLLAYSKTSFDIKLGDTILHLDLSFAGECKYSSKKSFFLVPMESKYTLNFPLSNIGKYFLPDKLDFIEPREEADHYPLVTELFDFDIYEKIVEVDITNRNKTEHNYNDELTYRACEQLFNATTYDQFVYLEECDNCRSDVFESMLCYKWIKYRLCRKPTPYFILT